MMKLRAFLMMGLGVVMLAGCQNKNQQQTAHSEEPYSPGYSSLDSMDAAPGATQTPYTPVYTPVYTPPAEPVANTSYTPPADNTADEPLSPSGGQVYTVRKGDSLYVLARRFYSDQARWRDIWEANRAAVPDPDKLSIGMTLVIP